MPGMGPKCSSTPWMVHEQTKWAQSTRKSLCRGFEAGPAGCPRRKLALMLAGESPVPLGRYVAPRLPWREAISRTSTH